MKLTHVYKRILQPVTTRIWLSTCQSG